MAQIFKVTGYIIDPEDSLISSDIVVGMLRLSESPIYTQHLTVEQGRDIEDMDVCYPAYQDHPLLQRACTRQDCEKYFGGE